MTECKIGDFVLYKNKVHNINSIFQDGFTIYRKNRKTGEIELTRDIKRSELIHEDDLPKHLK
jgi:hypothetical protein